MSEFVLFILLIFVFVYSKSRADKLSDEIKSLQSRQDNIALTTRGSENRQECEPAAGMASAAAEAITAAQLKGPVEGGLSPAGPESKSLDAVQAAKTGELKSTPAETKKTDGDLEFKLGSKVFTAVGVVAIICAIGFFLRYAFENNLINSTGRVALGIMAGLILIAVGEITRKRYQSYSQALTGGGLGVLYLSFYAAFSFYQLLAQPAAFLAVSLVTAGGILLALRQNSMGLAVFAQIGGFLTPLLIDSGSGSPHILFLYIFLLNITVFMLAFYKLWSPLSMVSFAGTALSFLYWYSSYYNLGEFTAAQGYLSLFFMLFLAIPFIQYFVKKSPENSWDMALVAMNPLFYFLMSYEIINQVYPDLTGWFTISLGALYCALAASIGGQNERASRFRHFLLTSGFVLLAIAVPIQFDGKWIAVAWAAESLAFIASGFKLRFTLYRVLGNILLFFTMMRIILFESYLPDTALHFYNARFLTYVMFFVAAASAAYIFRRKKNELGRDEKQMFSILALEGAFMGLLGPTLEIHDLGPEYAYWYPIFWCAGGLAAGALSFRLRGAVLRLVTYSTFAVSFFRLIFFESYLKVAKTVQYVPVLNHRVFAFLASAAAVRYFLALLRRNKDRVSESEYQLFQPLLFIIFHLLLLWMVSAEIIGYCNHQKFIAGSDNVVDFNNLKNVLLSVAWAVYGGILLAVGIVKKAVYERFMAIALFFVVIFKVFLIDTANLDNLYRFFSFITLGCILLMTGYLYYRYQDRLRKFVKGE